MLPQRVSLEDLNLDDQLLALSYLNLNQLAKGRLVSRAWRDVIERHLETQVTHIRIMDDIMEEIDILSYTGENYLSERFVLANPCFRKLTHNQPTRVSNVLFSKFVNRYCPNLQVLYAPECFFHYPHLILLTNLRYFMIENVIMTGRDENFSIIFPHLILLESFDIFLGMVPHYLLARHLYENEKPIHKLLNLSTGLMNEVTFQSMAERGINCLEYDEDGTMEDFYPINATVAQHLRCLKINFFPDDKFVLAPLPSLRYLKITGGGS